MSQFESAGPVNAVILANSANHSTQGYGLIDNEEYLSRCQVDTPPDIVTIVWTIAHGYRDGFDKVLDAGAGDARFSKEGNYREYFGYELDPKRLLVTDLPQKARVIRACAFSAVDERRYSLSIGNPPYVRHHDLSEEWRRNISEWIESSTGYKPSGLSNAYLYFLWLSIITTSDDGLVVLVIPFEWVERPAAQNLRRYIRDQGWSLDVYKFDVDPFPRVLTTASITVIDKRRSGGNVTYYGIDRSGVVRTLESATKSNLPPLNYQPRVSIAYAQRGLSPGGQSVFVLTEEQRLKFGLEIGSDVSACVTSLRHLDFSGTEFDKAQFEEYYVKTGKKCWLILSGNTVSDRLLKYLNSVPLEARNNYTCNKRKVWWEYSMPNIPALIYSSGFRGDAPKTFINSVGAVAIGSVCGIHAADPAIASRIATAIRKSVIRTEVVAVSRGFTKIEVNQMNAFIQRVLAEDSI